MAVVAAIIPVFLIILCGYCCRRLQFPEPGFWRGAEQITYFILFPALLVSKMATADLSAIRFSEPIIVVLLLYTLISAFLFVCKPFAGVTNAQFTSIYQGGIRFNTYIGFAVVSALYGSSGLVVAVILASIMIPVINICCVLVLESYNNGHSSGKTAQRIVYSVATNPLILACLTGMGINVSGISVSEIVIETLNIFARAALPLGLLTVGAALTLNNITAVRKPLFIASITKFMVLPALAMGLCELFDVASQVRSSLLVLSSLPTAAASYVLARQLGGDYQLMATLITLQTLLAALLMPVILLVFG